MLNIKAELNSNDLKTFQETKSYSVLKLNVVGCVIFHSDHQQLVFFSYNTDFVVFDLTRAGGNS